MDRLPTTRLNTLLEGYLKGSLTPAESDEFAGYVADPAYAGIFRQLLGDAFQQDEGTDMEKVNRDIVIKRITGHTPVRIQSMYILRWLPYAAAAVLIAITVATWIFVMDPIAKQEPDIVNAGDIAPGMNRATLTLADGRVVDLSAEQEGIIIQDGITYLDGSRVMENEGASMENESATLNAITTPKGGTYQVTLPDGSKVWLNAASTLRYPNHFHGKQRIVFLEGEAYFEIAKSVLPFKVESDRQVVHVLGTEFNISAYADDDAVKTTLVNGAVSVASGSSSNTTERLRPGERSTLSRNGTLTKAATDITKEIAWKNGRISFTDVPFFELMRQVSRWYDIDVVYEGTIPNMYFEGEISRSVTLQTLLKFLNDSGVVFDLGAAERKLIIKEEVNK